MPRLRTITSGAITKGTLTGASISRAVGVAGPAFGLHGEPGDEHRAREEPDAARDEMTTDAHVSLQTPVHH